MVTEHFGGASGWPAPRPGVVPPPAPVKNDGGRSGSGLPPWPTAEEDVSAAAVQHADLSLDDLDFRCFG